MQDKNNSISADDDDRLMIALGNAFEKAATTCATKYHAAQSIIIALQKAGFKIRAK